MILQEEIKGDHLPGTPKDMGPPYGKLDSYYPKRLGIRKWEWYGNSIGKGSHVLGGP